MSPITPLALPHPQVLLRWINYHIRGFIESNLSQRLLPITFRVTNLHSDLADALALSAVLHQVVPPTSTARNDALAAVQPLLAAEERARLVLAAAKASGVEMIEVLADDITTPRPRLLLAFAAAVFHSYPGLTNIDDVREQAPKRTMRGSPSQAREVRRHSPSSGQFRPHWVARYIPSDTQPVPPSQERAMRMWITSLGLGLESMSSLHEDCRDGIAFLRVIDFLEPGSVDWEVVVLEPRSIYVRVQNCNRAVAAARERGLRVEGVAGKDLADGLSNYILSFASQLMRSHVCQFLGDLEMDERDVLTWANMQVRRCDESVPDLRSFGDETIRDGVFLLQLVRSVAPDCVRPELVLHGHGEDVRQQNAKYAISCAHKAGCTVFATWEDIVEVRPRAVLYFLAAAMAEDLRRHETIVDGTSPPA